MNISAGEDCKTSFQWEKVKEDAMLPFEPRQAHSLKTAVCTMHDIVFAKAAPGNKDTYPADGVHLDGTNRTSDACFIKLIQKRLKFHDESILSNYLEMRRVLSTC